MAIVYFLVKSKIVSFEHPTLRFEAVDQPGLSGLTVAWNQAEHVAPHYSDPENLTPAPGLTCHLALAKDYCLNNGISIVGLTKRPDYLGTEAPPGGWYILPIIKPRALTLETHDGTRLNLLDDKLVLPGSLSSGEEGTIGFVISEAGKILLGVAGALDPYRGKPTSTPGEPNQPRTPDRDPVSEDPTGDAKRAARVRELFYAIARVLE